MISLVLLTLIEHKIFHLYFIFSVTYFCYLPKLSPGKLNLLYLGSPPLQRP